MLSSKGLYERLTQRTARYPGKEYPKVLYLNKGVGEYLEVPIRKGQYGTKGLSHYERTLEKTLLQSEVGSEIWRIEADSEEKFRKVARSSWISICP